MTKDEKIKEMKLLKNNGLSYGDIALQFGLSRQRVHQLISGYRSTPNRPIWLNLLYEAIKIRDKNRCQTCGKKELLIIHHKDRNDMNNNPDNLICLCNNCHLLLHKPIVNEKFRLSNRGKGFVVSEETKEKLRIAAKKRPKMPNGRWPTREELRMMQKRITKGRYK